MTVNLMLRMFNPLLTSVCWGKPMQFGAEMLTVSMLIVAWLCTSFGCVAFWHVENAVC